MPKDKDYSKIGLGIGSKEIVGRLMLSFYSSGMFLS